MNIKRFTFYLFMLGVLLKVMLGCNSDKLTTMNGVTYERYKGSSNQKINKDEIAHYRFHVSPAKINFPSDSAFKKAYFQMVDSLSIKELNNPIYDVLYVMNKHDSVLIQYKKNPLKKYPLEYGDGSTAFIWVVLDDIIDDEKMKEIQQSERKDIMNARNDYFEKLKHVDSLMKNHLKTIKQVKIEPDTVIKHNIPIFYISNSKRSETRQQDRNFISLSYAAYLDTGKRVFSSFENREPYITNQNSLKIPPGWRIVLQYINWDQSIICKIPSQQLYASKGFEGNVSIPPNTDLWFYFLKE